MSHGLCNYFDPRAMRSLILIPVDSSETGYFLDFDHLHLTPVQPLNILLLEEQNA